MRPPVAAIAALFVIVALSCSGGSDDAPSPTASPALPTATVVYTADDGSRGELTVELARTPAERSRGLMLREELPEEHGMLFVYERDTRAGFWMKDTDIPLSIAFLAAEGTVLEVQDMEPLSTDLHRPAQSYRYALEVNQGWFQRHGVAVGNRLELP